MAGGTGIGRAGAVVALVLAGFLVGAGPSGAQAAEQDAAPFNLKPTAQCPQADIDELHRVITFVRGESWAEEPGDTTFQLKPDTAACRVVIKISHVSSAEQAALERGGEGRLSIEKAKDNAEPSRLPLILWVIFGGSGLVLLFARYGRR